MEDFTLMLEAIIHMLLNSSPEEKEVIHCNADVGRTGSPPDRDLQLLQPGGRRPRVFDRRDSAASPRAEIMPSLNARTVRLHLQVARPVAKKDN